MVAIGRIIEVYVVKHDWYVGLNASLVNICEHGIGCSTIGGSGVGQLVVW